MERKFVGKVVSDGPVTMREAREAGLIKGEPKEATPEEHAEAIKAMEDNEKAVKKAREDEDMDILCPNCNSDDILRTKEGYVCARCDFEFKVKIDKNEP